MKENESEKISENNLGKNKRPCSLYFNKNVYIILYLIIAQKYMELLIQNNVIKLHNVL